MKTAIVGGGAAGLSLALMLGGDVTVYEAEPTVGGLCRSTQRDGFTFDQGPHILGGIPAAVEWIINSTGLKFYTNTTNNRAWLAGKFCAHPFEDERDVELYQAKMWKTPPGDLSLPGLGAQAGRRPGGVPWFRYPRQGGYQAITDAWAAQLGDRLRLGVCVTGAGADRRVVWTGPRMGRYNTLTTVTFGFEGTPPDLTAIYIPGAETPFHRVNFPASFSPNNAPPGCFSVQGEVTGETGTIPLLAEFAELLGDLGIAKGLPIFMDCHVSDFAYPVPLRAQPDVADGPLLWHHGRTGAHRYLNVDGVVAASMELAEQLNA